MKRKKQILLNKLIIKIALFDIILLESMSNYLPVDLKAFLQPRRFGNYRRFSNLTIRDSLLSNVTIVIYFGSNINTKVLFVVF